jgi:hypothetical protein
VVAHIVYCLASLCWLLLLGASLCDTEALLARFASLANQLTQVTALKRLYAVNECMHSVLVLRNNTQVDYHEKYMLR